MSINQEIHNEATQDKFPAFIVVTNSGIIYRCRSMQAGIGFIDGHGEGVLCQVLCNHEQIASENSGPATKSTKKK